MVTATIARLWDREAWNAKLWSAGDRACSRHKIVLGEPDGAQNAIELRADSRRDRGPGSSPPSKASEPGHRVTVTSTARELTTFQRRARGFSA